MPLLLAATQTQPPLLPSITHHHYYNNKHQPLIIRASHKRLRILHSIPAFASRSRPILFLTLHPPKSASSINGVSVQNNPEASSEFLDRIRKWIQFIPKILPGGTWWDFSYDDVPVQVQAQPVTVWRALGKMWNLVARDRWVIFAAFSALILAAVSEISIPHFLTASIFSAQGADIAVFHRNVRLLVLLCIISGICRSKSLGYEVAVLALQT